MRDLRTTLARAKAGLHDARQGLVEASKKNAGRDPAAALALAQLAAAVDAVAARVPPRWPVVSTPNEWLFEADDLHRVLTDALHGLWPLQAAAEGRRSEVPLPDAAAVQPGDVALFGRGPEVDPREWRHHRDLSDLEHLHLPPRSAAAERRLDIVEASDRWARDVHAAAEAAGADEVRIAMVEVAGALGEVSAAAVEVPARLMSGVHAKARIAARALVEEDDDPVNLGSLAQAHAVELGWSDLNALAWSALSDLLAAS